MHPSLSRQRVTIFGFLYGPFARREKEYPGSLVAPTIMTLGNPFMEKMSKVVTIFSAIGKEAYVYSS